MTPKLKQSTGFGVAIMMSDQSVSASWREKWGWKLVPGLLLVLVMAFKWETFSLPGYWDELLVFINSGLWFTTHSLIDILPGLHSNRICYGHPPFIFFCLAVLYRIFGYSNAVTHIFSAFFGFLGVYGTYLLGRFLHDRRVGLIAALLLFFSPIYYAQTGMVSAEIFLAALSALCVYFLLAEKKWAYLVAGICLAQTKASCMAVFVAIMAYQILFERKRADFWRRLGFHALPLVSVVTFLVIQHLITGHAVDNPDLQQSIFSEGFKVPWLVFESWHIGKLIFFEQWRLLPAAFLAIFVIVHYRRVATPANALFLFIFFGFFGAFVLVYFLPRYILTIFPFFFIAAAQAMVGLERNKFITASLVALLCGLSLTASYLKPANGQYGLEVSMAYADFVRTNMDAARYVEGKYANDKVSLCLAGYTLTNPEFGYVSKKIEAGQGDYDVAITPENATDPDWGCKKNLESMGYVFDNIFDRGAADFIVYVKPGTHKFE